MNGATAATRTRRDLAKLLSSSIGIEKALECVVAAAIAVGLGGDELSQEDALQVLERIATEPGIVGVTARFAKSRVHLIWTE
jgi:hypothetical protein